MMQDGRLLGKSLHALPRRLLRAAGPKTAGEDALDDAEDGEEQGECGYGFRGVREARSVPDVHRFAEDPEGGGGGEEPGVAEEDEGAGEAREGVG